jgi:hypothetical protein
LDCRHVCKTCAFHDAFQSGKEKEADRTHLIWCLRAQTQIQTPTQTQTQTTIQTTLRLRLLLRRLRIRLRQWLRLRLRQLRLRRPRLRLRRLRLGLRLTQTPTHTQTQTQTTTQTQTQTQTQTTTQTQTHTPTPKLPRKSKAYLAIYPYKDSLFAANYHTYQLRIEFFAGGSFWNRVPNSRFTIKTDLLTWKCKTQNWQPFYN